MGKKDKTYVIATCNEEDTIRLGKILASAFEDRVIAVCGDLGAGKTHFAKGIALGMGIAKHVTSPTFSILNIYRNGDKTFYHMDAYRLTDEESAYNAGIEDILQPKGITLIEWAKNVTDILPDGYVSVNIEKGSDENKRLLYITADRQSVDRMALLIHEDTDR